jgi:predicted dehydrogenase
VPMELPRRPFYDKELSLLLSRSYGPGRYDPAYEEQGRDYPAAYVRWTEERNFEAFLELCADRRVDVRPLISHRFPIDRAGEAYRLLSGESDEPYLGILLTYPEREVARAVSLGAKTVEVGASGDVRLGFAGAGAFAGSVLVPAFARVKSARLKTIVSARGVSARHLGVRFGFSDASSTFEDLCSDAAIDAVVISTRHHLHAAQTIAALEAGKHVFVEKPMALSREEVEAVRTAAASSSKILLVGFNRRFAPLSRKLASFFEERRSPLAMAYRVNAGPMASASWIRDPAVGGGRIVGEVCHFVDLMSYLAGAPPVRVQAVAAESSTSDPQFIATLAFGDGSIGTIVYGGDGDPAYPKERLEVLGHGRVAVLDDFRALELSAGGKRSHARSMGQDKGHSREAEAFVEAASGGAESPIALASLCATSLATFAIEDAIRTGETQVIPGS